MREIYAREMAEDLSDAIEIDRDTPLRSGPSQALWIMMHSAIHGGHELVARYINEDREIGFQISEADRDGLAKDIMLQSSQALALILHACHEPEGGDWMQVFATYFAARDEVLAQGSATQVP